MDVLALESSGLNSGFQGLRIAEWWGVAPMEEMVKKWRDSGMTWTELEIE